MFDKPRRLRRSVVAALAGITLVPALAATAADATTTQRAVPAISAPAHSPESSRGLHVTSTEYVAPASFRASARLLTHDMPANLGGRTRTTALLFVPQGPKPAGGWPVIAWAHGTSTPGSRECAPSLTPDHLDGGLTRDGFTSDYAYEIGQFVRSGYAVVAPDFEGLGAASTVPYPYYGATSNARSLIFGVKAARQIDRSLSNRYAVVGHSDGGHAVLGVEAHAGEVPGLTLTGTVALAPYASIEKHVAEFARQGQTGDGVAASVGTTNAQFNVALMATGLMARSPAWDPAAIMGEDLRSLLPEFKTLCSVEAINLIDRAVKAGKGSFDGYKPGWAQNPAMKAFLTANDPAADPSFTLRRPTLIEQGTDDSFVLSSLTSQLVTRLRQQGAPVTYGTIPGDDHFEIIRNSNAETLTFVNRLFRR